MSLSSQFYEDQQKKKKKPSQEAAQQNKSSGGSLSENFFNAVKSGEYKQVAQPAAPKPTAKPAQVKKSSNPLSSAIDTIKKTAQSAIESITQAVNGPKTASPIPEKDIVKPQSQQEVLEAINGIKVKPGQGPDLSAPVAASSPTRSNPTVKPPNIIDTVIKAGGAVLNKNKTLKDAVTNEWKEFYDNPLATPADKMLVKTLAQMPNDGFVEKYAKMYAGNKQEFGKGLVQGIARTTLNSSDIIRDALDTEVRNTPEAYKGARDVGDVVGQIASYIAPSGVMQAKLGKLGLGIVFGVLGQTSTDSSATGEQRLKKAIVDTTAGLVFGFLQVPAKVLSLKKFGLQSAELGTLIAQTYGDIRALGGTHEDAITATRDAMTFNAGLIAAFTVFGLGRAATTKAFESKVRSGGIEMTPEQARVQVEGTNLDGTPAGDVILRAADDAQKQGKNLKINMVAAEKSKAAQLFKAETPQGIAFGIDLVEKSNIKLINDGGTTTSTVRQPGAVPESMPSIIKEAVTPSVTKSGAVPVTTASPVTPATPAQPTSESEKFAQSQQVVAPKSEDKLISLIKDHLEKNDNAYVDKLRAAVKGNTDKEDALSYAIFQAQEQIARESRSNKATPSISSNNRTFNQKNSEIISKAVVAGKKETLRLSNSDQLQIAIKYEANNLPSDATADTLVTVYRAGKSSETKVGDFVTLDKSNAEKYVGQREGAKIMTASVPLKDLVFSGGIKSEFIYSPAKPNTEELAKQKASKVLRLMGNQLKDISIIGSTARGKENPNDLDILITPEKALGELTSDKVHQRVDLQKVFEKELQSLFPDKKLHVTLSSYKPERGPKISISQSTKPSPNSKDAKVVQESFTNQMNRAVSEATDQKTSIKKVDKLLTATLSKVKNDKKALAGIRTSLNKEMFGLSGATGNYKSDYALLHTMFDDPDVGDYLSFLQEKIIDIDNKIMGGSSSGGDASKGIFADLPKQTTPDTRIPIVEFPELVRIVKELTGKAPVVRSMKRASGMAYSKDLRIKLDPEIFKDPGQAAKVLAHELGHIADYLPDKLRRGNLIGRIATLNKHMKAKYGDLVNKEIRQELMALSAKWRPISEDAKGLASDLAGNKYRSKSSELYADAISVLFNDPAMLKNEAPKFWSGLFAYMDRKPTVKENFFATWDLLNKGEEAVFQQRQADVDKMFKTSEEQFVVKNLEKQKEKTNYAYVLKLLFNNKNEPIIRKVNQARKEGKLIDSEINPVYAYEGLNYLDGKLENFVQQNYQPIFEQAQGISSEGWQKLGSVLLYERSMNERGEMANPLGFNPKTAADQMKGLEKSMSPEDWTKLQDTLKLFRKATEKLIKMAEDSGFYSPELLDQMKANNSYATYQVIDYLDTYVSAHVYKAVGTLKEIANPATSTIMKGISVMKAIERNNAKKTAVDFMKTNFEGEIAEAKSVFKGKKKEFVEPKDSKLGMVRVVEDGKMKAYYVEKDLANMINSQSNDTIIKTAKIARIITGSGIYRPLFTSLNLGFSTFNFVRDFQRYWSNVPDYTLLDAVTSLPRALFRYGQAVPSSVARARNKQNATITAMKDLNILGATYNGVFEHNEVNPEDLQIERIMKQYGILDKSKHKKIFAPIFKVLDSIEAFNTFVETLPKVAGYNELKGKNNMTPLEMADFMRTKVGSPNFRVRGELTPVTNSVFLFSNAIKEGIKSDFQVGTGRAGRASAAGFWWKTIASTLLPSMIMMAGALGLLGKWYEDRMRDVSEYDKTNFTIVPTGVDEDGKTTYLRVPRAETQRFIGGLFWKIMNTASRKDLKLEDVFDVFDYGSGQLPSLTPAITGFGSLVAYLSGHNPYDAFRNRNVIPDTEFKAGFESSFPLFVDWFTKNQGAGIILPSYVGKDPTQLQKNLALPFISNVLGRWMKVSDYGKVEEGKRITDAAEREQAQNTLKKRELIDKATKEYKSGTQNYTRKAQIERQLVKDVIGIPLTTEEKTAKTNLIKQFEIGLEYGKSGPLTDALIRANTNAQKVDLILNSKDELGSKYDAFLRDLLARKIITKNVMNELRKKK